MPTARGRGGGARFAFELESLAGALEAQPRPTADAAHPSRRDVAATKHVLLVEDDADTAEALCALLQLHGYRVRVARNVASALEGVREGCDVLVSDLKLPDGSGHQLLRQLPTGLPAIAVSGYGTAEDMQRSRDVGFVDHLVKPVSSARLLSAIERALGSPAPAGADRIS